MPDEDYPEYCAECGHEGCICNTIVPKLHKRLVQLQDLRRAYIKAANRGESERARAYLAEIFDCILNSEKDL